MDDIIKRIDDHLAECNAASCQELEPDPETILRACRDEIARLRITAEEREAIAWAAIKASLERDIVCDVWAKAHGERAATLRGLLERHAISGKLPDTQ